MLCFCFTFHYKILYYDPLIPEEEEEPLVCEKLNTEEDEEEHTVNGQRWRMQVDVWVEKTGLLNFRSGEVGARMRIHRRTWGFWKKQDPDQGRMHLLGEFFDKNNDCEVVSVDEQRDRPDPDNDQQAFIEYDGARVFPDQLGCTFGFKQGNTWYDYDNGNPLVLP